MCPADTMRAVEATCGDFERFAVRGLVIW